MATKTCPSCGIEVPAAAPRCKSCFHDFTEKPPRRTGSFLMLAVILALMGVIGAGVLYYASNMAQEHIVVDAETKSIVFTKKFADRVETDRLPFDQVGQVVYVIGGSPDTYMVDVVLLDGSRRTIMSSDDSPQSGYADHVAAIMGKQVVQEKRARGFGD